MIWHSSVPLSIMLGDALASAIARPLWTWYRLCKIVMFLFLRGWDLSHKSHNAPVAYPTMHHFVTEMCTFLLQNCALWDFCLMYYGICELVLFYDLCLSIMGNYMKCKCTHSYVVAKQYDRSKVHWSYVTKIMINQLTPWGQRKINNIHFAGHAYASTNENNQIVFGLKFHWSLFL